jgi:ABC-type tungstate transport system substrate-binding protein
MIWTAIISAVSRIVSTVGSSIDKSNLLYTQRQDQAISGRTSNTMTRNIVLAVVAIAVVFVFIKLSKSE